MSDRYYEHCIYQTSSLTQIHAQESLISRLHALSVKKRGKGLVTVGYFLCKFSSGIFA